MTASLVYSKKLYTRCGYLSTGTSHVQWKCLSKLVWGNFWLYLDLRGNGMMSCDQPTRHQGNIQTKIVLYYTVNNINFIITSHTLRISIHSRLGIK